jgi:hypothetical protein
VGSNPTQGMDVCVCLFCVCVVLCVGSGLATGCLLVEGDYETEEEARAQQKDCRAIVE